MSFNAALANLKYDPADLDQFNNTNQCPGCDLSNAYLNGNHSQANLQGTNLTFATLSGNFSISNISDANGSQLYCKATNLSYTNFSNTILNKAVFYTANLEFADFTAADLYGAKITADQLSTAASMCNAILPDGSIGKCP